MINHQLVFLKFLLAISEAVEFVSFDLKRHQLRVAYISFKIAMKMNMEKLQVKDVVFAALIHDIGALTPEEKINLRESKIGDLNIHCKLGKSILKKVKKFDRMSKIMRYHHTFWNDDITLNEDIKLQAQIIHLADFIESSINNNEFILLQRDRILSKIDKVSETQFDPKLVGIIESIFIKGDFWLELVSLRISSIISKNLNFCDVLIENYEFYEISELIRDIIDFKSTFTAYHSAGVSTSASLISKFMDKSEDEILKMKIAGNLHDLGKMVIPNCILNKPGKLTYEEFAIVKQHTYYTYMVLKQAGFPNNIIEWAAYHHEKLNGNGYPFHLKAEELSLGARILAVEDIFTELHEDRLYRKGMEKEKLFEILNEKANCNDIDVEVVRVLEENYDEIVRLTKIEQEKAKKKLFAII